MILVIDRYRSVTLRHRKLRNRRLLSFRDHVSTNRHIDVSPYPHIPINHIASGVVFAPWGWYRFSCQAAGGLASVGGPLMAFSPDCWEKISQRGAGSFDLSTGPGTPFSRVKGFH